MKCLVSNAYSAGEAAVQPQGGYTTSGTKPPAPALYAAGMVRNGELYATLPGLSGGNVRVTSTAAMTFVTPGDYVPAPNGMTLNGSKSQSASLFNSLYASYDSTEGAYGALGLAEIPETTYSTISRSYLPPDSGSLTITVGSSVFPAFRAGSYVYFLIPASFPPQAGRQHLFTLRYSQASSVSLKFIVPVGALTSQVVYTMSDATRFTFWQDSFGVSCAYELPAVELGAQPYQAGIVGADGSGSGTVTLSWTTDDA